MKSNVVVELMQIVFLANMARVMEQIYVGFVANMARVREQIYVGFVASKVQEKRKSCGPDWQDGMQTSLLESVL